MTHSPSESIVVLSADPSLIERIRDSVAPSVATSLGCICGMPAGTNFDRLILDPRELRQCCLEKASRLNGRMSWSSLKVILYPAVRAPLLEVVRDEHSRGPHRIDAGIDRPSSTSRPTAPEIWRRRKSIFKSDLHHRVIRRFLDLTLENRYEAYSVAVAATNLRVSPRQLYRYCLRAVGTTPGLLIDLARAMSVEDDLIRTDWNLEVIAFRHSFHDAATMSRFFMRYAGERPGAYRAHHRRPAVLIAASVGRYCH